MGSRKTGVGLSIAMKKGIASGANVLFTSVLLVAASGSELNLSSVASLALTLPVNRRLGREAYTGQVHRERERERERERDRERARERERGRQGEKDKGSVWA